MASDIFRILVQYELSNLPVTCTQMIAYTEFVSIFQSGAIMKALECLQDYMSFFQTLKGS